MNPTRPPRTRAATLLVLTTLILPATAFGRESDASDTHRMTASASLSSTGTASSTDGAGVDVETSPSGSFTKSLPIIVPAFYGIEPQVSLEYDSSTGNGGAGVGWRLQVGSRIVRRGVRGGQPRYDSSDEFVLDGMALVACAPNCRTGGTHETRQQSFERIVFDGSTWTRWRRDGVKLVYEAPNEVAGFEYEWSLARLVDTHGNTVTFEQDCSVGTQCEPAHIRYAASTSACGGPGEPLCKTGAAINFYYEPRSDVVVYPTGVGTRRITRRPKTIEVRMDGELLRAYALHYAVSTTTGASLLRSVQQFGRDATVAADGTIMAGPTPPLPPTILTTPSMSGPTGGWELQAPKQAALSVLAPPAAGFPVWEATLPGSIGKFPIDDEDTDVHSPLAGDFDGDGRTDVLSWRSGSGTLCPPLYVKFAIDGAAHATSSKPCAPFGLVADIDGDFVDDLVLMNNAGNLKPAISQRDRTFAIAPTFSSMPWVNAERRCSIGDLDADDRDDVVCVYRADGTIRLGVARSTATEGFTVSNTPLPADVTSVEGTLIATGDVDDDGADEIMLAVAVSSMRRLVTGDRALDGSLSWSTTTTPWPHVGGSHLAVGDVNGDARRDYVLIGDSTALVATSEKGAPERFVTHSAVSTGAENVTVGDTDGDGLDDLVAGAPAGVYRSNGDGTFQPRVPLGAGRTCSESDPDQTFPAEAFAGDGNGDGLVDLYCSSLGVSPSGTPRFDVWSQPSPVSTTDVHRWMPADTGGDGRQDLVYVQFRNPGYVVYTLTGQADGSYLRSETPIVPPTTPPPSWWPALDNPNAAGWLPLDVGSPSGSPDGKTDLVLIDRAATTLRLITLLSTGTGWKLTVDTPWKSNGTVAAYGAADVQNWRPAAVNGDGSADLVHFTPLGTGVRVEYLLSNGDGTWTSGASDHFNFNTAEGGPLTRSDVGTFREADLNNDGLADYFHVEVGGGPSSSYYVIRSLVSTGPTQWEEQTWKRSQPIDPAAAHDLQPADVDGDGVSDAARVTVVGGCVQITALIRSGTAWSSPRTATAAPCQPAVPVSDRRRFVFADVNGDRRADLYHLSRYLDGGTPKNAIYTLVNPGAPSRPWTPIDQPGLPITHADSWAWMSLDTDHDATAELVHAGPGPLTRLRWTTAEDRVTAIDNGHGATTSVAYRAQADARTYLPVGMLPIVVDHVTVQDAAYQPALQATASFDYAKAKWSIQHRQMIGYGTISSRRGKTVVETGYHLSDTCDARRSSTAIEDSAQGLIARTRLAFTLPGTAAPFTCLTATSIDEECEFAANCRQKRTAYRYDRFGNIMTVEESGDAGRRRTYTPTHPNTDAYIVDRPYKREVQIPITRPTGAVTVWQPQTRTLYGYDDRTWHDAPLDHGDLTRVTEFSNIAADAASEALYQYDSAGNLTRTVNPVGVVTTVTYDTDRNLFPLSTCDPVGCTTTVWDETLGVADSITDANQQTITIDHDNHGRVTKTTAPDGASTTTSYLDIGTVTGPVAQRQRIRNEVTDDSRGDGIHWHEESLDGLGRVYQTRDEGPTPTTPLISDVRYIDASDRPAAVSDPHTSAEEPRWTSYEYDAAHRLERTIHPGQKTGSTSRTFHVGAVEDRDEAGHVTTTHHDSFGRIVRVDESASLCTLCETDRPSTEYRYDPLDRLIAIVDAAGATTTIVRDALGREKSVIDPDRGTQTRIWRADGSLDTQTDTNGTHHWTYDAAGRPSTRTDSGPTGAGKAHWFWDRDATSGNTQGFSIGHPTLITYSSSAPGAAVSGTDRFWYDNLGRTTRTKHCVDGTCQEMGYTYDRAGRLSDLRYPTPGDPDGEHVKYAYDPAGRLTSVGGYLTNIEHNSLGQTTSQTYGNGLVESFTYGPDRHWIDSQALHDPATKSPVYAATYTHNLTARITRLATTNPTASTAQPVIQTFAYDELGRLISTTGSDFPSRRPPTYEYDATGRITRSPTAGSYHYDDPAHVHAVTSTDAGHERGYDAAGNLTSLTDPQGRSLSITWTPTGMSQTITDTNSGAVTSMGYNADGQRVKRRSPNDITYYFGRYLEQDDQGRLTKYYWAGDQMTARRGPDGAVSYLLQDHVGSTRVVTDEQGNVTGRYNYEPYGAEKADSIQDTTTQRWLGQPSDGDTGLTYMNARYYDPELAQFISADTIVPNPYRPQSLNRYSYVENDPINRVDPSGHMSMRVELKKEQEYQGLRFGAMYARSFGCDVFAFQCIRYTSGQLFEHRSKTIGYSNGTTVTSTRERWVGAPDDYGLSTRAPTETRSIELRLSTTSRQSSAGHQGSDPSEWSQWPAAPPPPPPPPLVASTDLASELVEKHEGRRHHVYLDIMGIPTIGVGFNLDRAGAEATVASLGIDYLDLRAGHIDLTDEQIDIIFQIDLARARADARSLVANFDMLDSVRQDALVDMAFQMGHDRLSKFVATIAAIEANDFDTAADEMLDSAWADQTPIRAEENARIMRGHP
jgi:RHS repeat-associated protein